jgi:hypothetical protein
MDEDILFYSNDDNVEDEVDTNILAMGQDVEHNNNKYKRKWDCYLIEKKALLNKATESDASHPLKKGLTLEQMLQSAGARSARGSLWQMTETTTTNNRSQYGLSNLRARPRHNVLCLQPNYR